jgi:hypothetical protein
MKGPLFVGAFKAAFPAAFTGAALAAAVGLVYGQAPLSRGDLPKETPIASAIMKCWVEPVGADGIEDYDKSIVVIQGIVIQYPGGRVITIDRQHTHGVPVSDAVAIARTAKDHREYYVDCPEQ